MPVRSLNSSLLRWPEPQAVLRALRSWVRDIVQTRGDVARVGYFGSLSAGRWGVGSDLDLIVLLRSANESFERRGTRFDTTKLPVPVDLLVYSQEEWERMTKEGRAPKGVVWLYGHEQDRRRGEVR